MGGKSSEFCGQETTLMIALAQCEKKIEKPVCQKTKFFDTGVFDVDFERMRGFFSVRISDIFEHQQLMQPNLSHANSECLILGVP